MIKVGWTPVGRTEVQNSSSKSVINGLICNFMPPCGAERTFDSHLGHPPREDLTSSIGLFERFQTGRFLQTFFHSCEQNGICSSLAQEEEHTSPLHRRESLQSFSGNTLHIQTKTEQFVQIVGVKWEQTPRCVIGGRPSSRSSSSLLKCEGKKKTLERRAREQRCQWLMTAVEEQGGRRRRQRRDM